MARPCSRLAAALLLGTALTACSSLDFGGGGTPKPKEAAQQQPSGAAAKPLAADLDVQIRAAQASRTQGDYDGATRILSQLMMVAPDNSRIVGEYGKTLVQQGRAKEALDFLKRAVELAPGDWSFYSATGVAYDQTGDYADAQLAYQHALSLRPGDAGILNNYALSRMQAGESARGRKLLVPAPATGASDPKIPRHIALLASVAPQPAPA